MDLGTKLKLPATMQYLQKNYKIKALIIFGKRAAGKNTQKDPFEFFAFTSALKEGETAKKFSANVNNKGLPKQEGMNLQVRFLPMMKGFEKKVFQDKLKQAVILLDIPKKTAARILSEALTNYKKI